MCESELLHRLLYMALIELREQGREHANKVTFHLSDLLHNVPLQLFRVGQGELTSEEVLSALRDRARESGTESWLDQRLTELRARSEE